MSSENIFYDFNLSVRVSANVHFAGDEWTGLNKTVNEVTFSKNHTIMQLQHIMEVHKTVLLTIQNL